MSRMMDNLARVREPDRRPNLTAIPGGGNSKNAPGTANKKKIIIFCATFVCFGLLALFFMSFLQVPNPVSTVTHQTMVNVLSETSADAALSELKNEKFVQADLLYAQMEKDGKMTSIHFVNHGYTLVRLGKIKEAREKYLSAIRLDGKNVFARNNLALLDMKDGNWNEAERGLRMAMDTNPGYRDARVNLALLLEVRGRWDAARELYEGLVAAPKVTGDLHALVTERARKSRSKALGLQKEKNL